jgi:hypothetical protein
MDRVVDGVGDVREFLLPVSGSARVEDDGSFRIEIGGEGTPKGPVTVGVKGHNGVEVLSKEFSLESVAQPLRLEVRTEPVFTVTPSDDPTLGARVRLTGQVIDELGRAVPAGLPVVIWGVDLIDGGGQPDPRPLVVTETTADGFFAGDWTADLLTSAFGRVAGGPPVPVPLDDNKRLNRRALLVIDLDEADAAHDPDCTCETVPPRAPDPTDVTTNPGAFSQDLGGGCVDLTVPNRALEEFSYFLAVRTSEPRVKGVTLGVRKTVPRDLMIDLLGVSVASQAIGFTGQARLQTSGVETRAATAPLALDVHTAQHLVRSDLPPTAEQIARATWLSEVGHIRGLLSAGLRKKPSRSVLDADDPIDWDETPTIYQSMEIAHGHLLQYREVWRADGYSLGDLLYSLPLAPGQRRQIAVVDWDRRTSAARTEQLEFEEELDAVLSRDRDIQEIVGSQLHEESRGGSRNTTWGVAGGIGAGFIGSGFGIFGGVAGGAGGSDSSSWQRNSRTFSADSLQQLRDRVAQRSSAVRSSRSSVVQTVAQGETARAETEVVANYNRCHAITVEYFEVLRHFLVTHELADVSECLFVPLPMFAFDRGKALRWREPLRRYLKNRRLRGGFTSIDRIADNWVGWDYPESRYSEEAPETLEGELRISFFIPRPRDDEDGQFQIDMWEPFSWFLPVDALEVWTAKLNERTAQERDRVFREEIAPEIAQRLVQGLRFAYVTVDGGETEVPLDATLVSRYRERQPLYVTINPAGELPEVPREDIAYFKIWFDGAPLPPDAQVIIHRGKVRYRTPHYTSLLFNDARILDDIRTDDSVLVATPTGRHEMRNPRDEDRELAANLVDHLNEHLEHYHQAIWVSLDAQRRYMLLDAIEVPGLGGRSIASVCTNELIGIAGNSLILPVAPGQKLDPSIVEGGDEPVDLVNAYSVSAAPPMRVSVPTRGQYAEAVSGDCNSCERIDDSLYWRWTTEGQLALPPIGEVSTDSRQSDEPNLTPTPLPAPIVAIQNAPEVPAPVGLDSAFGLLSQPGLFRDITGLEGTQKNAAAAFEGALSAASALGNQAAKLASQQELGRNAGRMLDRIDRARQDGLLDSQVAQNLAESALKGLIGEPRPTDKSPTDNKEVKEVIDKAAQSPKAEVKVTTPSETVDLSFDDSGSVVGASPSTPHLFTLSEYSDRQAAQETVVGGAPGTHRTTLKRFSTYNAVKGVLRDFADSERFGIVRRHPVNAGKYQLQQNLRIVYPAKTGALEQVDLAGRLPVAVLVHGNHGWVTPAGVIANHDGYSYLQEALARAGIVSVSVDNNAANAVNALIEMRAEIIMDALDIMRRLDRDAASRFHQRLDLDSVGLMGHSRGGDAVARAAALNAARPAADRFGIKAVCSLAPTDFSGTLQPAQVMSLSPTETPFYAVVYGALDGDVGGWSGAEAFTGTGFRLYDRATCDKAMVFIDHCNHNRFNRTWTNDDGGMDPADIGGRLLSRADHEKLAIEYIGGLFEWRLAGKAGGRNLFEGSQANSVGAGASLQWSFGTQVEGIDDFEAGSPGGGITRTLTNSAPSSLAAVTVGARSLDQETNHQTIVLAVDPGIASPAPVTLDLAIPAGPLRNWSSFDELTFRVSSDSDLTSAATIVGEPLPDFTVIVEDGAGAVVAIAGNDPRLPVAMTRPVFHRGKTGGVPPDENLTALRLETIRVPLSLLAGVDRTQIVKVSIAPAALFPRHMFFDSVQLIRF